MTKTNNQKEICSLLNMSNGNLQTYKKRLINKGLITSTQRGTIDFTLPRFKEFLKLEYELNLPSED